MSPETRRFSIPEDNRKQIMLVSIRVTVHCPILNFCELHFLNKINANIFDDRCRF